MTDNKIPLQNVSSLVADLVSQNLRPAEAAIYTGLSEPTLARLRMRRNRLRGPVFYKIGGCVIYRRSDLDDWLAQHRIDPEN